MQFVRKAEEALTGKKDESHESTQSSNHGPHSSNLANKLDPRVDSDRDNRATHTGVDDKHLGTSKDYGSGTAGATTGTATSTTGPHKSSIANKLDPRVDSTHTVPAGTHGTGAGITGAGTTHTGTHGLGGTTGQGSTLGSSTHGTTHPVTGTTANAGPHDSNVANKADPRVDSDRDHRARHETVTATDLGATHGTGTTTSTNAGPHDSNIANKLDPRVDSDRDNRARHETTTGTGSAFGATHGSTNAGPHDSNIANKADPRIDSDRDNRALLSGSGTAPALGSTHGTHGPTSTLNTGASHSTNAGPHDSNIANKLDPRVDSDLDSRATHQSLSGIGAGTTTHGSHTRDTAGLASDQGLAGSSYNTPAGTATRTSGTTATAGPHDSSIANKLDPTVDSHVQTGTQRKI